LVKCAAIGLRGRRGPEVLVAGVLCLLLVAWQLAGWSALAAAQTAAPEASLGAAQQAVQYASYQAPRQYQIAATERHPAYSLYAPGDVSQPHVALVVLHGMGGDGPSMASLVLPYAQAQNWIVVAPTIAYGDWRDPVQVGDEDLRLAPQLATILDSITAETGETISERALVFGFSRGAQEALRFSLFYPGRVQAVAALSAGTYTLPVNTVKTVAGAILNAPFPYGVSDFAARCGRPLDAQRLAAVRFLIGVGAADNKEGDVPRQWDPYVGKTRVERATRFGQLLNQFGYQAEVAVVPGAGHEVNGAMIERVITFLTQNAPQSQIDATTTQPLLPPAVPIAAAWWQRGL
jgi:predicted esterase